ncbi:MAG: hypothetical protein HOO93_13270 [Methyloglobulus sp.]|nr:hypothetical protein [Methyloglobulus sp.]
MSKTARPKTPKDDRLNYARTFFDRFHIPKRHYDYIHSKTSISGTCVTDSTYRYLRRDEQLEYFEWYFFASGGDQGGIDWMEENADGITPDTRRFIRDVRKGKIKAKRKRAKNFMRDLNIYRQLHLAREVGIPWKKVYWDYAKFNRNRKGYTVANLNKIVSRNIGKFKYSYPEQVLIENNKHYNSDAYI